VHTYGGTSVHYIRELAAFPGTHSRDLIAHQAAAGQYPLSPGYEGDGKPPIANIRRRTSLSVRVDGAADFRQIVNGGWWPRERSFCHMG